LKKIIYDIEKATLGLQPLPSASDFGKFARVSPDVPEDEMALLESGQPSESTAFARCSIEDSNALFTAVLNEELDKIVRFYARKESELVKEIYILEGDIKAAEDSEEKDLLRLHEAPVSMTGSMTSNSRPHSGHSGLTFTPLAPPPNLSMHEDTEEETFPESYSFAINGIVPGYFINLMWSSAGNGTNARP
jgi:SPX domain